MVNNILIGNSQILMELEMDMVVLGAQIKISNAIQVILKVVMVVVVVQETKSMEQMEKSYQLISMKCYIIAVIF